MSPATVPATWVPWPWVSHSVLAIPIAQERATQHLDTVCTMVDVDKIVMYPNVADSLTAYAVTVRNSGEGAHAASSSTSRRPSTS